MTAVLNAGADTNTGRSAEDTPVAIFSDWTDITAGDMSKTIGGKTWTIRWTDGQSSSAFNWSSSVRCDMYDQYT